MLFEQMPPHVRARDPLIEACLQEEATRARAPGFGRRLYHFIRPLLSRGGAPERLIRAACLLHDVNWRAHPDYRADVCFDAATRGNLGGLDHPGRIFLGLALLHRYRNARSTRFEPMLGLLSDRQRKDAEILGRAMRFGAMFSANDGSRMGQLQYRPKRHELILTLPRNAAGLYGEVAAARFAALAEALEAEPIVKVPR
jgi:exopolyphosphatase/guanosine-5'-triphosphate,3'-diphosphate pyrophosphatase